MNYQKVIKTILPFLFLFMVTSAIAGPGEADETEDSQNADLNPAPISDYIIPMLVLGVATAFVLLRKKNVQNV